MAGIIQGNGTKADLLASTNIVVGSIYKVTDPEGFGEWLIKSGTSPYGVVINFAEVCTGAIDEESNAIIAYAEKIDGRFANNNSSHNDLVAPYPNILYRSIADEQTFISTETGAWVALSTDT